MTKISEWVERHYKLIQEKGLVLDLAGGSGRHTRFLALKGYRLVLLDKDVSGAIDLRLAKNVELIVHDLEVGKLWPLNNNSFDGIIVTNYLYRPIMSRLLKLLSKNGVLIYETFALGNERFGGPKNPDYLLKPGELIDLAHPKLRVIAYEECLRGAPSPAFLQRIAAVVK